MTSEVTISHLPDQEDNKAFYNIKIEWLSTSFNLLIIFKNKSWQSQVNYCYNKPIKLFFNKY